VYHAPVNKTKILLDKETYEEYEKLQKDSTLIHNDLRNLNKTINDTKQQVVLLLFFGIILSFFINLYANIINEHFHHFKYYDITVGLIFIFLLLTGAWILKKLFIDPLEKSRDELSGKNKGLINKSSKLFKKINLIQSTSDK